MADYSYEWVGYGVILYAPNGADRLVQGEDGSELYDTLDNASTDDVMQDIIAEYFV